MLERLLTFLTIVALFVNTYVLSKYVDVEVVKDSEGTTIVIKDDNDNSPNEEEQLLNKIGEEFSNITDEDDKFVIRCILVGVSEYLHRAKKLPRDTRQLADMIANVRETYGWETKKYEALSEAVSDYLKFHKFNEPKNIDDDTLEDLRRIFGKLADAVEDKNE